jgi:ADP-heptose:LPS heptosyltransferase
MSLTSRDFPPGTPLHHFFAWNEAAPRWRRDRRYKLARNPERLPLPIAQALQAANGSADIAAHAAVFAAFERLEHCRCELNRHSRASGNPEPTPDPIRGLPIHRLPLDPSSDLIRGSRGGDGSASISSDRTLAPHPDGGSRRILVIRLSALGDFIQALGPIAAIRRCHAGDHISLLTTGPLAGFATELGYFDEVIVDQRPGALAIGGWLRLRRRLRRGRFDRVYDLQTSTRSSAYAWLLRPGMPEWSGIAWRCSHPHANRDRDPQHTLDKQAEQLLMAGIYPTPLPALPPFHCELPPALAGRDFVLLVPGSSPGHPEKRWPAEHFGALARALEGAGCRAVIVGTAPESPLAVRIRSLCPDAVDLTGQTDLGRLGALAQRAALTIGNDTGICHLAAAAGCPVIVLFSGGTDPVRCAPRGRHVEVLAAADLRDLAPDMVIAASRAILGGRVRG